MNRRTFLGGVLGSLLGGLHPARSSGRTEPTPDSEMHRSLLRAIHQHRLVHFTYKGHERTVEPHLYGETSTGEPALAAYQIAGGSESGDKPSWRLFACAGIERLTVVDTPFHPRPGFGANAKNPWRRIFAQVVAPGRPPS